MHKINWCFKKGMKLVDSRERLALSYLKMAEDSLGTMNREKDKNLIFSISAGYYSIYYSLYAILQKIGIKSEIHSCSIEFAKKFLKSYYSPEDFELIETAFSARKILQYYVDKTVNKKDLTKIWNKSYDFFVKSRDILSSLKSHEVIKIRSQIK